MNIYDLLPFFADLEEIEISVFEDDDQDVIQVAIVPLSDNPGLD